MQWTAKEASEFLMISEDTVHEWIERRGLPATLFNDRYHFNRIKLVDWALENRVPILSKNGSEHPSLSKTLRDGGIFRDHSGEKLAEVLKEMVGRLPLPPGENRDLIWRMILAREKEGSTALGDGLAIPHARHPILLRVGQPLLALSLLENPIDMSAPDGKPVHALFLMISPNIQTHLHYLERLGHALHDREFLDLLRARKEDPSIYDRLLEIENLHPARGIAGTPASNGTRRQDRI